MSVLLKLVGFLISNDIETHGVDDNTFMFLNCPQLEELFGILKGSGVFEDGGVQCFMKDGYICVPIREICEWYGLDDLKEVLNEK